MAKKTTTKIGAFTLEERDYISKNKGLVSNEILAKRLNRSVDSIDKFVIKDNFKDEKKELNVYVQQLHASPFWPTIKSGLLDREESYFESQWAEYMEQFTGATSAQATDYMMIKDIIIFDIMFSRAMAEKRNAIFTKKQIESRLELEMNKAPEDRDQQLVKNDQSLLASLSQAVVRYTDEINDFQQRKDSLMKSLKGTREQRFKQIEESRSNIFECIKELDDKKKRIREGIMMAKMKEAADKISKEWAEPVEFENGDVDNIYLSPEYFEERTKEEEDKDRE